MIIIGTLWGVVAVAAMIYAVVEPRLNAADDLRRFNNK